MAWAQSKILVNNAPVQTMKFPGGEINVRLQNTFSFEEMGGLATVDAVVLNSDDMMAMMLTVDAARRAGAISVDLRIPYLPYARQDRIMNPGEALSIAVIARMINSLKCRSVTVYDPHSPVTEALIDNLLILGLEYFLGRAIVAAKPDLLVSPDAGAEKKVLRAGKHFEVPVVCASKLRDPVTGAISGTRINGSVEGKRCLIVDDICDGGATFVALADLLIKAGAVDVQLFVTHGIFSKGFGVFDRLLSAVHFTNSRRFQPDAPSDAFNTIDIKGKDYK